MRLNRIVSFTVGLALLGLPGLVAGAGSASAASDLTADFDTWPRSAAAGTEPYKTSFARAKSLPGSPVYGSMHEVGGFLLRHRDDNRFTFPGQTVTLLGKASKSDTFVALDNGTTDADGLVVFSRSADRNFIYRLTYAGGTVDEETYQAGNSKLINVGVRRVMTDKVAKKGGKITYKGKITPEYGKKTAILERKTCKSCNWKTFKKEKTSAKGTWSFVTPAPGSKGPDWFYRVKAAGDKKFVTSYTPGIKVYLV